MNTPAEIIASFFAFHSNLLSLCEWMYAIINNILTGVKEPSLIEAKAHHHWRAPVVLTLLIQTVQLSFNIIRVTQGHRAAQCVLRVQRERCCRSCGKYFSKRVGSNFFTCQTIQPLKFPIKYKVYIFTTRSSFWKYCQDYFVQEKNLYIPNK